ncbi:acyl-coenzyme A synthetase/AMP-(fatty) acid ligase [Streptosporangium sandarakinum]|uniref:Acyl-coenzyme A synthetase/AMP-(Fatty) acid ligase n=1 Tax=Streptosporangium sandarakinum TaxID=1260955 RepID=A0A852V7E9_9ACTN|nr:AMP-binding protein [Streptosporangium sandarakinum]NYF42281.1 acyl-coenzyme A synthetase/AMP-(fatty) acid ligase [Streptosporangium sandarakinum]
MPTWTDVVLSAAGHRGERPAVTDAATGDVLSYAALAGRIGPATAELRDRGVAPGDRVVVRLPPGPGFPLAVHAAAAAGALVVPLAADLDRDVFYECLAASRARMMITDRVQAEWSMRVAGDSRVRQILTLEEVTSPRPDGPGAPPRRGPVVPPQRDPGAQPRRGPSVPPQRGPSAPPRRGPGVPPRRGAAVRSRGGAEAPALTFDGSRVISHAGVVAELRRLAPEAMLRERDRVLVATTEPRAQAALFDLALMGGAHVVAAPGATPGECRALIEEYGITVAAVPPWAVARPAGSRWPRVTVSAYGRSTELVIPRG